MSQILEDGHSTKISFSLRPAVAIEIVTLKPFGVDAGDNTVMTNMNNTVWRTGAGKKLKTLTPIEGSCNYNPDCMTDIVFMAGVNQLATVTYPDGDRWTVWGVLNSFMPDEHKEGEKPTAAFKFTPTNRNSSGVETGPVKL